MLQASWGKFSAWRRIHPATCDKAIAPIANSTIHDRCLPRVMINGSNPEARSVQPIDSSTAF